jgi:hypothetical protein
LLVEFELLFDAGAGAGELQPMSAAMPATAKTTTGPYGCFMALISLTPVAHEGCNSRTKVDRWEIMLVVGRWAFVDPRTNTADPPTFSTPPPKPDGLLPQVDRLDPRRLAEGVQEDGAAMLSMIALPRFCPVKSTQLKSKSPVNEAPSVCE